MSVQSLISDDEFTSWFEGLMVELRQSRQRRLLSCEGSEPWCWACYEKVRSHGEETLLLSDRCEHAEALAFANAESQLGQEVKLVVVDLFGGFDPDVLCTAAGLVTCGGLLVLLSPGSRQWHQVTDQYGVWQDGTTARKSVFVDYFFSCINNSVDCCIRLRQGHALPKVAAMASTYLTECIEGKSSEQMVVLKGLQNWLCQSRQNFALITARRGRGKSTCLGLMVKKMIEGSGLSVYVTARSRRAAAVLLAQCETADFISPHRFIQDRLTADVLVIDEAAMLPFSILASLFVFTLLSNV